MIKKILGNSRQEEKLVKLGARRRSMTREESRQEEQEEKLVKLRVGEEV